MRRNFGKISRQIGKKWACDVITSSFPTVAMASSESKEANVTSSNSEEEESDSSENDEGGAESSDREQIGVDSEFDEEGRSAAACDENTATEENKAPRLGSTQSASKSTHSSAKYDWKDYWRLTYCLRPSRETETDKVRH